MKMTGDYIGYFSVNMLLFLTDLNIVLDLHVLYSFCSFFAGVIVSFSHCVFIQRLLLLLLRCNCRR